MKFSFDINNPVTREFIKENVHFTAEKVTSNDVEIDGKFYNYGQIIIALEKEEYGLGDPVY
jgi:hypothetical protein